MHDSNYWNEQIKIRFKQTNGVFVGVDDIIRLIQVEALLKAAEVAIRVRVELVGVTASSQLAKMADNVLNGDKLMEGTVFV